MSTKTSIVSGSHAHKFPYKIRIPIGIFQYAREYLKWDIALVRNENFADEN